ncbi:SPOR domain-containing protein [Sphingomonas mucosissima]|uniref:Sporulation related domain protein n=1 Tax=Sphingomonas mucosissima TaxID=370959 RepID=A0A245ZQN5_9SPHN|nr:SPOR domain-containing protein [Sphingomonas mucosissima]OWK32062.1 sporulation related domain protein [Sphingomonas mucosissima]
MSIARPLILAVALVGAPGALAQSYPGQQVQTVPRPTPDADALAGAMRRLGANPRDLSALLEAAELSLKLGDVNAAASLLKRAENVDPMNGRVKAGMARILVTQERPGEALRYFDQAIGYGLNPQTFAGDRGLAYDLIGEQERAQREYRLALRSGPVEEVQRRYSLSLGISGKRQEALEVIDDQVRRNDRSAWRVRAFVLAMTGDVAGAEKIASTMMPPGMGSALAPFFARVAGLSAADRAFAVHFGELRPSPQRLADARLVPALPPLPPEATRPVQAASAAPAVAPSRSNDRQRAREEAKRRRELALAERRERRNRRDERPTVAVASATAVQQPAAEPTAFQPPRYAGVTFAPPQAVVQAVPASRPAPTPVATPLPEVATTQGAAVPPASSAVVSASGPAFRDNPVRSGPGSSPALASDSVTERSSIQVAAAVPPLSPTPVAATPQSLPAINPAPLTNVAAPAPSALASAVPPPPGGADATTGTRVEASPAVATAQAPVTRPALSEDTILARIMAGISIPGAELGIAPVRPPEPTIEPAPRGNSDVAAGTSLISPTSTATGGAATEAVRKVAETSRGVQQSRTEPTPRRAAASAVEDAPAKKDAASTAKMADAKASAGAAPKGKTGAGKEAADADTRKSAAETKAAAAKKLADAKKGAEAKKAADEKAAAAKAAKAEPARIWVQVAGGANKDDLPKAWSAAQSKAAALKGKSAYTTPLRATNRVVTGPFKSDQEAREFVNTLAKQGVSAFQFTSDEGQKMTRLPAK